VLVFTTHGRGVLKDLRTRARSFGIPDADALIATCEREGFAYQDYLSMEDYGISVSLPAWVCARLAEHPELELVGYTEDGWNWGQDVVACRRGV
jgi:hypothetical protein